MLEGESPSEQEPLWGREWEPPSEWELLLAQQLVPPPKQEPLSEWELPLEQQLVPPSNRELPLELHQELPKEQPSASALPYQAALWYRMAPLWHLLQTMRRYLGGPAARIPSAKVPGFLPALRLFSSWSS